MRQETIIVKKGTVYYIGKAIFLFFRGLAFIFKTAITTIIGYFSDINMVFSKNKKTKKLLRRKDIDTEVV